MWISNLGNQGQSHHAVHDISLAPTEVGKTLNQLCLTAAFAEVLIFSVAPHCNGTTAKCTAKEKYTDASDAVSMPHTQQFRNP